MEMTTTEHRNPTLPLISDAEASEDLQQIYEMCQQAMGGVPHLTRVIANCPELLGPFLGLAGAVSQEYKVPLRVKQLAVLRTAELNGCSYCRSIHVPKSDAMGVEQEKIDGVGEQTIQSSLFDDEELTALAMADEMTGAVGAKRETVERAKELWGGAGVVELMMTVAFYNLMTRLAETSQVPLEG